MFEIIDLIDELVQYYEAAGLYDYYNKSLKGLSDEEIIIEYYKSFCTDELDEDSLYEAGYAKEVREAMKTIDKEGIYSKKDGLTEEEMQLLGLL